MRDFHTPTLAYSNIKSDPALQAGDTATAIVASCIEHSSKNGQTVFSRSLDQLLAPGGIYEGKIESRQALVKKLVSCNWEFGPTEAGDHNYRHYVTERLSVAGTTTKAAVLVSHADPTQPLALSLFIPRTRP